MPQTECIQKQIFYLNYFFLKRNVKQRNLVEMLRKLSERKQNAFQMPIRSVSVHKRSHCNDRWFTNFHITVRPSVAQFKIKIKILFPEKYN